MNIEDYLKMEELGRLVASSPPTVTRVMDFYNRLYEATIDMGIEFSYNGDFQGESTASALNKHAHYVLLFFKHARKKHPTPNANQLWNTDTPELTTLKENALKYLERAGKMCNLITGKKCTWLSDRWETSVNAMVNDATAIFHRLIERVRPEIEFRCPKCSLSTPNASEFFKTTACSFGIAETILSFYGATSKVDANEVHATIYENRVDFRVGSSPGHMTELTKRTLMYYDSDMPVNRTMRRLLMDAGVTAEIVRGELPGLRGKLLKEKPVLLGATIAMATSMDFRINAYNNILYALRSHEYDLRPNEAVETFWPTKPTQRLVRVITEAIIRAGTKYPPSTKYYYKIEKAILHELVIPPLRRELNRYV